MVEKLSESLLLGNNAPFSGSPRIQICLGLEEWMFTTRWNISLKFLEFDCFLLEQ